eukprot:837016-Pyramimonas_sp.AAC.1
MKRWRGKLTSFHVRRREKENDKFPCPVPESLEGDMKQCPSPRRRRRWGRGRRRRQRGEKRTQGHTHDEE